MGLGHYGPKSCCDVEDDCIYSIQIDSFAKTILGTAPTPPNKHIVTAPTVINDVCSFCWPDGCREVRFRYFLTATDVEIEIQCRNQATGEFETIHSFELPLPPDDTCVVWAYDDPPCEMNIRLCCGEGEPFDQSVTIPNCPECKHYPFTMAAAVLIRRFGGGLEAGDYEQSPPWNGLILPVPEGSMRWTQSDPYELFHYGIIPLAKDSQFGSTWSGSMSGIGNTEHPFYAPRATTSTFSADCDVTCTDTGTDPVTGSIGLPILSTIDGQDGTHDAGNGCDADGCLNPFNRGRLTGIGQWYEGIVYEPGKYIDLTPGQVLGDKDVINAAQTDFPLLLVELETPGYNWSGVLPSNFQSLNWSTGSYADESPYSTNGVNITTHGFTNDTGLILTNMPATWPYGGLGTCIGKPIGTPSDHSKDRMSISMNCDGTNLTWQWIRTYGWLSETDATQICAVRDENSVLNGMIEIPTRTGNTTTESVFLFAGGSQAIGLNDVTVRLTGLTE